MLDGRDVALLMIGSTVGPALWAGIGVGLGAIIRNQVAAVIALLAWMLRRRRAAVRPRAERRQVHAERGDGRAARADDPDLVAPAAGALPARRVGRGARDRRPRADPAT